MVSKITPPINEQVNDAGFLKQVWANFFTDVARIINSALTTSRSGAAPSAVTVTASPFIYSCTATGALVIVGAITGLTLTRALVNMNIGPLSVIRLAPGDAITVTYTTTPTIKFLAD